MNFKNNRFIIKSNKMIKMQHFIKMPAMKRFLQKIVIVQVI